MLAQKEEQVWLVSRVIWHEIKEKQKLKGCDLQSHTKKVAKLSAEN